MRILLNLGTALISLNICLSCYCVNYDCTALIVTMSVFSCAEVCRLVDGSDQSWNPLLQASMTSLNQSCPWPTRKPLYTSRVGLSADISSGRTLNVCLILSVSYDLFCSLPQILVTFNGPADLCVAVSEQIEAWQLLGLSYFTPISTNEIQTLEDTLMQLKGKRFVIICYLCGQVSFGLWGSICDMQYS